MQAYFEWYHPEGRYPKEKQYQLERKSWRLFISTPFFKMVLAIFALIFAFVVLFVANEVYDDWKPARWRAAWAAEDAVEQADKQAAKQAAGNSTLAAPQPVSQPRLNMAVAAPSKPAAGTPGPQPAMYRQQSAAGAARKQTAAPVAPGDTAANALLQTLQHSGTTAVPSGASRDHLRSCLLWLHMPCCRLPETRAERNSTAQLLVRNCTCTAGRSMCMVSVIQAGRRSAWISSPLWNRSA